MSLLHLLRRLNDPTLSTPHSAEPRIPKSKVKEKNPVGIAATLVATANSVFLASSWLYRALNASFSRSGGLSDLEDISSDLKRLQALFVDKIGTTT